MKKRKPRRFAALFLVCMLLLGLIPTDVQRPLYDHGTVNAAEQDFSDGKTTLQGETDTVDAVPVQTGSVKAGEDINVEAASETESEPAETTVTSTEQTGEPAASTEESSVGNTAAPTGTAAPEPEVQTDNSDTDISDTDISDSLPHNDNTTAEGTTDIAVIEDEFSDGETSGTNSGETEENKNEAAVNEASDGSLAGNTIYFKDTTENGAITGVSAVFDGGSAEAVEVSFQMGEDGYYSALIPEGDYSRLTFQTTGADGVKTAVTPSYRYYEGQSAMENTQTVLFQKDVLDTYYYAPESNSYWAAREAAEEKEPVAEPEENRITEPSDGSWAGQKMHFVNLYWEDQELGDVYALFQGGESDDQAIQMSQGERGKYTVTVPEGDYSRVSFAKLTGTKDETGSQEADGQETSADTEAVEIMSDGEEPSDDATLSDNAAEVDFFDDTTTEEQLNGNEISVNENIYRTFGGTFQYYGEESAANHCSPVAYQPDAFDTYYYDTAAPERSYWGADALYEPNTANSVSTFAVSADQDQAGKILYFMDLTNEENPAVKLVTMQFWEKGHESQTNAEPKTIVMYEGRENIYSAPIPDGGYEEVTFLIEYESGDPFQMTKHFNLYNNAEENDGHLRQSFQFEQGNMDTIFYSHYASNTDEAKSDIYWGPHPSMTDRSLDTQYVYIDVADRNSDNSLDIGKDENGKYELWLNDGNEDHQITAETRNSNVLYYQFASGCHSTEQTVLILKWNDTEGESHEFRFCYPYDSGKKMIVMDHIRTMNPVFEEYVADTSEQIYVMYDNSATMFGWVQYRISKDGETWEDWENLTKTNPNDWTDKPNAAVVENLWGAAVSEEYKYIQFRGTEDTGLTKENDEGDTILQPGKEWYGNYTQDLGVQDGYRNPYLWRTTNDNGNGTLALIPSHEYSYPCFYGIKEGNANSANESQNINITGKWMSALDIRNLAEGTVAIPEGTFTQEDNTYYGNSTFYDYYSDYELKGVSLSTLNGHTSYKGIVLTEKFNDAVEAYYAEKNADATPLYLGVDLDKYKDSTDTSQGRYNRPDSNKNSKYWNHWQIKVGTDQNPTYLKKGTDPVSGMVYSELTGDELLSSEGVVLPYFNKSFLLGDNSLGTAIGKIYSNVAFPFTKNDEGYWEFDSMDEEQSVRIYQDPNTGYYLNREGLNNNNYMATSTPENLDGKPINGFFPFNSADGANKNVNNPEEIKNHSLNYMFGANFSIPFSLPEGNEVVMPNTDGTEKKQPVTFEFSGDDDTWIFVDGKLVLDIGGIHDRVTGIINFKEKTWEIRTRGNSVEDPGNVYRSGTFELDESKDQHTLTMYYMERGLGASNLRVTFNFPKENTLSVTNQIDYESANDIFDDALSNIGSFAYRLKNQAVSGKTLPVGESQGYVKNDPNVNYNDFASLSQGSINNNKEKTTVEVGSHKSPPGSGKSLSIRSNEPLKVNSKDITDYLVSVPSSDGGTVDVMNSTYLRFYAYNDSAEKDNNGESIFVALTDSKGNRVGGWANKKAYEGSSNSLGSKEWSLVRISIKDLALIENEKGELSSTFDYGSVKTVDFADKNETPIYITDLDFYPDVTEFPKHGFSVEQDEISDYGSIEAGGLTNVDGAWFSHYEGASSATYRVAENGFFALGSNERAEFIDKFRVGSYVQIEEADIDPRVFDVSWSILENGHSIDENYLRFSRSDTHSVKNGQTMDGKDYNVSNVQSSLADDGRTSVVTEEGIESEKKRPDDGALVFRSYSDPDNNEVYPINLTVAYKNVLKTGDITITKKLDPALIKAIEDMGSSVANKQYTFLLEFTDIAGMALEDAPIQKELTVTVGANGTGSVTFTGIPAGTKYTVTELKTDGAVLKGIENTGNVGTDPHDDVIVHDGSNENDSAMKYVEGTAYQSEQSFAFTNTAEPFVMKIEKHWEDDGAEAKRPKSIGIYIERKVVGSESTGYEVVKADLDGNPIGEEGLITLTGIPEEDVWILKDEYKLPFRNEATGELYTYQIREVTTDTNAWDISNYDATYTVDTEGTYIVTNRIRSLRILKTWADQGKKEDGNGNMRPDAIKVQLYRSVEGQEAELYRDPIIINSNTGDGGTSNTWNYGVSPLELVSKEGKAYTYTVKETHFLYDRDGKTQEIEVGKFSDNKYTNGYRVSYSDPVTSNGVLTLEVTNANERQEVYLEKKDTSEKHTLLSGATFTLIRLRPEYGTKVNVEGEDKKAEESSEEDWAEWTEFKVGAENKKWEQNIEYGTSTLTTGKDGKIDFGFLPYGYYRLTEIKAPDGYILDDTPYDFFINDETVQELGENPMVIERFNSAAITLPTSGAAGTFMFTLAGLVLVVSAMLLYKLHLQKTRKRIRARAVARKNEREE